MELEMPSTILCCPLRRVILVAAMMISGLMPVTQASAQPGPQAVLGDGFGVARVSLPLPAEASSGLGSLKIIEASGRIRYPALVPGRAGEVLGEVLGADGAELPSRLNVSFLFTGNEPLELTVFTPQPQQLRITPAPPRRPREYDRMLQRWWRDYNAVARRQQAEGDYPPVVETYLTSMLGQRFGLRPPLLTRVQESEPSELQNLLGLLFGVEDLRLAVMRETMAGGGGLGEAAKIPVPNPVEFQPPALPPDLPSVEVESIAMHVPVDCFYVRFGSFENYLWFDRLKDDYGGNLGQMVTLRGHDAGLDAKTQQQLALKQSELAEVMGPQIISDIALIGRDLYLREGAAIGMLFEAKNTDVLQASLTADRQTALQQWRQQGATLENVEIAGRQVSLLSTPDNQVRSYHAIDGNYHLVTTSRSMVESFFAAGAGEGALGASAEFQHARWRMPLDREDTIFAYLSSMFFRSLLSPQYQIELTRRLQSVTDMELLQMAKLAAAGEGPPVGSIDDLIAGGFLPPGFGRRGEQERPVSTDDGYLDARRGLRGYYTPIPDVPLRAITPTEAKLYDRAARFLKSNWQQMDPLLLGVKRYALDQERMERVVIDANVSPIAEEKYGWVLSMLGPPVNVRIQSNPSDVLTMQMSLQGGLLWPAIPAHQVFLGIQDLEPTIDPIPSGFLRTLKILQTTPGYLGAWPRMGLLDRLPFLSQPPDAFGFSQLPLGLWRWQGRDFSVLSFHHGVLADAAEFLEPVPTQNPAQIQIRVSDLAGSRLAGWVSVLNHNQALRASHGNVELLNTLMQQLQISPPDALSMANDLLNTKLVCTLGGEYEFIESDQGDHWRSTAWTGDGLPPEGYQAPLLEWFRGASLDLTRERDGLFLHAEIDMLRREREPAANLPLFDLFKKRSNESSEESN
jgi:hypothetical protein